MTISDRRRFMGIMEELEEAQRAEEAAKKRVEELQGRAKSEGLEQIRIIIKRLGGLTESDISRLAQDVEPPKARKQRKAAEYWYKNPADGRVWKRAGPMPSWLKEMGAEKQDSCKVASS
jgi:DNA-binding protein H-NS